MTAGSPLETEWSRLREQIRLVQDRFWFGIVVADPISALVLRDRALGEFALAAKRVVAIDTTKPEELSLSLIHLDRPDSRNGMIWISGFGLGSDWIQAWSEFLARLNERRDHLTRDLTCGLVIVGDEGINELARDLSTDLWAVCSLNIHVARNRVGTDSGLIEWQNAASDFASYLGISAEGVSISQPVSRVLAAVQKAFALEQNSVALELLLSQLQISSELADRAALWASASEAAILLGDLVAADDYATRALGSGATLSDADQTALWDRRRHFALAAGRPYDAMHAAENSLAIAGRQSEALQTNGTKRMLAHVIDENAKMWILFEDLAQAHRLYKWSLAIRRELASSDDSDEAKRDLSISWRNVARTNHLLGNLTLAQREYQESIELAHFLAEKSGDNETRREWAALMSNVAQVDLALGEVTLAHWRHQRSLQLFGEIADSMGTFEARRDLVKELNDLASLELAMGKPAVSLNLYERSIEIALQLADRLNTIASRHDLLLAYEGMAKTHAVLKNPAEVRNSYEKALPLAQQMTDTTELPSYAVQTARIARSLLQLTDQSDDQRTAALTAYAEGYEALATKLKVRNANTVG
jgi:hypothetical protein